MKLRFINEWSSSEVYVVSEKDNEDFELIMPYELLFDEDAYPEDVFLSETTEKIHNSIYEDWDPELFIELYKEIDQDNWFVEIF
jgi:hypothetical protein